MIKTYINKKPAVLAGLFIYLLNRHILNDNRGHYKQLFYEI